MFCYGKRTVFDIGQGRPLERLCAEEDAMRWLGLDFGSKTVGVAVTDPLGHTAQGVETITRKEDKKLRQSCQSIEALIEEYEITAIVLGYPKNMDDSIGERAEKTEEFKEMLERRTGLPVFLQDERLTTMTADEILEESGVPKGERKKVIDKVAATIILQDFMNDRNRKEHVEAVEKRSSR